MTDERTCDFELLTFTADDDILKYDEEEEDEDDWGDEFEEGDDDQGSVTGKVRPTLLRRLCNCNYNR